MLEGRKKKKRNTEKYKAAIVKRRFNAYAKCFRSESRKELMREAKVFLASSTRHFVTFVIFLFHLGNFEKREAHALRFLVLLFSGSMRLLLATQFALPARSMRPPTPAIGQGRPRGGHLSRAWCVSLTEDGEVLLDSH